MNDNNFSFNQGKPPKILDTYTRRNPEEKYRNKLGWYYYMGKPVIGKAVSLLPISYIMEHIDADSHLIIRTLVNSQAVIFPE